MTRTFRVPDMSCQGCASSVTNAVSRVPGVRHVNVDLESKNVSIASESSVPDDAIVAAILDAGYPVVTPVAAGAGN